MKSKSGFAIINLEFKSPISEGVKEIRTLVFGLKKPYRAFYEFNYEKNDIGPVLVDFAQL